MSSPDDTVNGKPEIQSDSAHLGNSVSRGKSIKRDADETQENSSPARRSKRLKSGEGLASLSQKTQPTSDQSGKAGRLTPSSTKGKKGQTATEISSLRKDDDETELSLSVKLSRKTEQPGAETVEETTGATAKRSTKKKTKEEKAAEMTPLAARASGLRMHVGAHVSAAKGVFNSINNSVHIGGNAFALFLKSQRKWDNPPLQDDHRDQFHYRCSEHKYDAAKQILPHGSYLVNLAQEDKAKAKQAYDSFLDDLRRCEALGIKLYNFHPGSANQTSFPSALTRLAKALTSALSETSTVIPVLETMCGHGTTIGGNLTDFRSILAQIPAEHHSRIGICVDTCHTFSAGYDVSSPTGWAAFMQEFDDVIGLKYLRAFHLNDSKAPGGSKRDLHANIGTGFLGLRAFHNVMNDSRLEGLPLVLETPIDRPASTDKNAPANGEESEGCASEEDAKSKKKPKKTKMLKSGATISDPSVWAREIKLLESLIGMDAEGKEFKKLEADLAEEGREMRQKHQEQYDRKVEAEEKKQAKAGQKGQKKVMDMMKGRKKGKQAKADDSEDDA